MPQLMNRNGFPLASIIQFIEGSRSSLSFFLCPMKLSSTKNTPPIHTPFINLAELGNDLPGVLVPLSPEKGSNIAELTIVTGILLSIVYAEQLRNS
jgi:hypothetical protein